LARRDGPQRNHPANLELQASNPSPHPRGTMPNRRSMLTATITFLPIVPLAEAESSTWSGVHAIAGHDNGVPEDDSVDLSVGAGPDHRHRSFGTSGPVVATLEPAQRFLRHEQPVPHSTAPRRGAIGSSTPGTRKRLRCAAWFSKRWLDSPRRIGGAQPRRGLTLLAQRPVGPLFAAAWRACSRRSDRFANAILEVGRGAYFLRGSPRVGSNPGTEGFTRTDRPKEIDYEAL